MATYLGSKYVENDMNNKLINGGAAAFKGLTIAGKFLYKLAKPVIKYASIRAVQGVGYLCKQAEYQLSDNEDNDDEEEEDEKDKTKKGKKEKKKSKKKKDKEDETKNSFNLIDNNQNNKDGSSLCLKEGQYIFQPCVEYPSFEAINKVGNNNINQNNDFYQNQNNNININQSPPFNNNVKPDYVIPPGLDSSTHDASIIGEK